MFQFSSRPQFLNYLILMNIQIIIYFLTKLMTKCIPSSMAMQCFIHQHTAAEHMWAYSNENDESQIMQLQPKVSRMVFFEIDQQEDVHKGASRDRAMEIPVHANSRLVIGRQWAACTQRLS